MCENNKIKDPEEYCMNILLDQIEIIKDTYVDNLDEKIRRASIIHNLIKLFLNR